MAGTSWYSPRYLAAGCLTSLFDATSPIYILLFNIFSPRVTRVTLVPSPNTTQSAQPERSRQRSPSEAYATIATRRWRLFRRQHAVAAKLETTPRSPAARPAARPAAPHRHSSPIRFATLLLTPCTSSPQEELAIPLPHRHCATDCCSSHHADRAHLAILVFRGAALVASRLYN